MQARTVEEVSQELPFAITKDTGIEPITIRVRLEDLTTKICQDFFDQWPAFPSDCAKDGWPEQFSYQDLDTLPSSLRQAKPKRQP